LIYCFNNTNKIIIIIKSEFSLLDKEIGYFAGKVGKHHIGEVEANLCVFDFVVNPQTVVIVNVLGH